MSNLRLPWRTEFALKFVTVLKFFTIKDFWETLRFPWKRELSWKFSLHVLNIIFIFRIFEQLALALRNRVALKLFTVLNIYFYVQDFWATWACPKNRVCPDIFDCIEFGLLFTFRIFEQLALALIFLTVLNLAYFLHARFLSNLRLP